MITEGIYHVSFSSSLGRNGAGLVVIVGGALNGGDHSFLYQGHLLVEGTDITAILDISRYNAQSQSVFGRLADFQLRLRGSMQDSKAFSLSGSVANQPNLRINIWGKWIKSLVKSISHQ